MVLNDSIFSVWCKPETMNTQEQPTVATAEPQEADKGASTSQVASNSTPSSQVPTSTQQNSHSPTSPVPVQVTAEQLRAAASSHLLWELALLFYKKQASQLNLDYETKINLSALYKQATLGP